jgi:hypothetical protein
MKFLRKTTNALSQGNFGSLSDARYVKNELIHLLNVIVWIAEGYVIYCASELFSIMYFQSQN